MSLQYLNQQGLEGIGRFYSKYRGIVLDNEDPENLGRIKVVVPSVSNESIEWAYPSSIQGSPNSGMKYITPSLGQTVWVELKMVIYYIQFGLTMVGVIKNVQKN